MSSIPARYFVVRPGMTEKTPSQDQIIPDTMVPVIPLDLLPSWVEIIGLPRELSAEDTEGMTNLGTFHKPDNPFQIRITFPADVPGPSPASPSFMPDIAVKSSTETLTASNLSLLSASQPPTESSHSTRPSDSESTNGTEFIREGPPMPPPVDSGNKTAAAATSSAKKPLPPPPGSYCRHYCCYGTCSYGNGCRYLHEMPYTVNGLHGVGLMELPAWWHTSPDRLRMGMPHMGHVNYPMVPVAPWDMPAARAFSPPGPQNPKWKKIKAATKGHKTKGSEKAKVARPEEKAPDKAAKAKQPEAEVDQGDSPKVQASMRKGAETKTTSTTSALAQKEALVDGKLVDV